MKKSIVLVIGIIVGSVVGIKAASLISASQIIYKNNRNVNEALDELYELSENMIPETITFQLSAGSYRVSSANVGYATLYTNFLYQLGYRYYTINDGEKIELTEDGSIMIQCRNDTTSYSALWNDATITLYME